MQDHLVHKAMPPGTKIKAYLSHLISGIKEAKKLLQDQSPLIFISGGFDTNKKDAESKRFAGQGFALESSDYETIMKSICESFPESSIFAILEGGYSPKALADSIFYAVLGLQFDSE